MLTAVKLPATAPQPGKANKSGFDPGHRVPAPSQKSGPEWRRGFTKIVPTLPHLGFIADRRQAQQGPAAAQAQLVAQGFHCNHPPRVGRRKNPLDCRRMDCLHGGVGLPGSFAQHMSLLSFPESEHHFPQVNEVMHRQQPEGQLHIRIPAAGNVVMEPNLPQGRHPDHGTGVKRRIQPLGAQQKLAQPVGAGVIARPVD